EAVDEGGGGERRDAEIAAARMACSGVHGIADECDLFLEQPDLANHDDAGVQSGAELGAFAERPPVSLSAACEPIAGRKAGAYDRRVVPARPQPPGGDNVVADVPVDLAASFDDAARDVDDE